MTIKASLTCCAGSNPTRIGSAITRYAEIRFSPSIGLSKGMMPLTRTKPGRAIFRTSLCWMTRSSAQFVLICSTIRALVSPAGDQERPTRSRPWRHIAAACRTGRPPARKAGRRDQFGHPGSALLFIERLHGGRVARPSVGHDERCPRWKALAVN